MPSKILLEFGCSLIPLSKRQGTFLEPGASHGDASIVLPFFADRPGSYAIYFRKEDAFAKTKPNMGNICL